MLRFRPDEATLDAVCANLTTSASDGTLFDASTRRAAFALYLKTRVALPLPDIALQWRAGSRQLPTGRRSNPADQATTPAYVHFGAVHIATERPADTAIACSFADAQRHYPEAFAYARKAAGPLPKTPSARLFTAFQNCGVFIYVPAGKRHSETLNLVWNYPQGNADAVFPYILLYVADGAKIQVLERHIGAGDTFLCGAVQIVAAADAECDYAILQQTGETAVVQHTRTISAAANARVRCIQAELGANFSRIRAQHDLRGAGAEISHAVLSMRADLQRADVHITTRHRAARTSARHIRRFILGGRSRLRNAEIIIAHGQTQTRNDVASQALLFSPRAYVEFEPIRSVAHGTISAREHTAIGSVDDETIFYLQTRGIPLREARRMVALAFFEPAIGYAVSDDLRNEIRLALDDEIDRVTGLAD